MTVQQKIDSARQSEARGVIQLLAAGGNANFADKIAAALLRAGYRLDPGEFDPRRIDAVVVLWTGVALDKPELIAVAREAWKAGRLAPVSIGRVEPPFGARDAAPMDLAGWRGDDEDPRWRFVLSDLESIKIRQRVAGPIDRPTGMPAVETSDAAGDLSAPNALANDDPVRIHHPARHLWRNHIRPSAAPFVAGMAVVSAAGLAAFSLGARNDQDVAPQAPPIAAQSGPSETKLAQARLREGASLKPATPTAGEPAQTSADLAAEPGVLEQTGEAPGEAALAFVRLADGVAPDAPDATSVELVSPDGEPGTNSDEVETGIELEALPEEFAAILPPRLKADALTLSDTGTAAAQTEEPAINNPQTEQIPASDLNQQALNALTAGATPSSAPAATEYLGDYFSDCAMCPAMAALDGGAFTMGAAPGEAGRDPAESPQRRVTIAYRFAIATRETTFDQWSACVADGGCQTYAPSDAGWGRGAHPVINVSYEDASAYARWLSAKTGKYYRLPSEAEWEFAARAGTATPFAFGRGLSSDAANINGREPYSASPGIFRAQTIAVSGFQPNVYGLFDMHGNVWEWTSDCWSASHNGGPATGAARIDGDCSRRVIKGGAWNTSASAARSAHRQAASQMAQTNDIGFRVVRILD
ncbi:SUMF1/EgtB/PvdO family nonheme iron enzyme [Hyphococcus sp.]|uniref:SUMF1/EgtB/PvdO family nonheme iron enzyme n=1 Tax=Hyphococcus sp. TaxID=2038636 RepID=UPI00208B2A9E|nr:MAG: hypothetical protein DHS20C04_03060 [Marinicaulis sp.]